MSELVRIDELSKYFDIGKGQQVHAVDKISFSIAEREIVGLVGESGSGKSTLGKTLLGLHDKSAGEVWYRRLSKILPQDADDLPRSLFVTEPAYDGGRDSCGRAITTPLDVCVAGSG